MRLRHGMHYTLDFQACVEIDCMRGHGGDGSHQFTALDDLEIIEAVTGRRVPEPAVGCYPMGRNE